MLKNALYKIAEKIEDAVDLTKESLEDVSLPIKTRKIAITGLSRSGKTVFITSLIDQLLHQKKISLVSLDKTFKVTQIAPQAPLKQFNYHKFSKKIKLESTWPSGTDAITSTILEFESKAKISLFPNTKFRLELIDYPGEWILDIALLGTSYERWSENIIEWMHHLKEPLAEEYLKEIATLNKESTPQEYEQKLHNQYSQMLRYLKDNHYSNLTPGRFLMPSDLKGDPILLFAPITQIDSPLYNVFKKRYEKYQKEIVKEIHLEHFKGFDKQIVLIDIIEALQNGPVCYEDMKTGLRNMLSIYEHKKKNFISQFFTPSINSVTFVATKADLVASSQHNNYLALLDEMIEDIRRELDVSHIKTNTQIVASLKCTQTIMSKYEGKTLSCIRGIDAKTKNTVEIYPGEMPSSFPPTDAWDTDNYSFEEFLPSKKHYKENEAFDHIHMDRVIKAIVGDLL